MSISTPEQSFADVLDQIYWSSKRNAQGEILDKAAHGAKFEVFVQKFLKEDHKFSDLFSDVWLWNEWPGRGSRTDTGADLIAKERYSNNIWAIQAKFYDPEITLQKSHVDSFFTELGRTDYSNGLIISTAGKVSSQLEKSLAAQSKQVQLLGLEQFGESTIDWGAFDYAYPQQMVSLPGKQPRKYQREAIDDVLKGFKYSDRGKLIMACGTGKTFTSLQLVQEQVPVGGTVLFLVPSIALLQQTLNEWTSQASVPLQALAVCSDASVGKRNQTEDVPVHELGYPASTDPDKLRARFNAGRSQNPLTVVFSTYQSIDVVHQAQQDGFPDFDLVICDEAHRTTGISQPGSDDSAFVRVHDQSFLRTNKRLYMTATPRIYVESSKAKAAEDGISVYSMDDETHYGPEFHRLGFGKAVEMGALSDYKVLVLAVDQQTVSGPFQSFMAQNGDIQLDDVARLVGCYNGLAKRGVHGERLSITDSSPMKRAVAFTRSIKDSKKLADQMERVGRELVANQLSSSGPSLRVETDHVDGTYDVLSRSKRLAWLEEKTEGTCRILSNAKCLTEGVDVPSLDAVMFLNPRNSQVDVVQAVGRVMRKSPGKEYGYIILPIAVPSDQDPETALNDNKNFKVVWDVLQALRAHDDRFEAMVNKIDLDRAANNVVDVITAADFDSDDDSGASPSERPNNLQEAAFTLLNATEWQDAIFARMVKKVGDRRYWEDWAKDVKEIAERQVMRIGSILDSDPRAVEEFEVFLRGLRASLNDGIGRDDAIDMLVQHMITKPVFNALFEDYNFTAHNPVSKVMDEMIQLLESYNVDSETQHLEDFYRSVRVRAEGISNVEGKQKIITELYERFFKLAFPRVAESLGIVYTPIEVVDFIIRAVDDTLKEHFGAELSHEGVHVLDPFTGTGTFIARLLQSGLIKPEDLLRKYTQELHANEILLMAYYIAAINIEATFHGLQVQQYEAVSSDAVGQADGIGYQPFEGIVLADTFQMTEDGDTLDERVFTNNNDRALEQNKLDIRVIIGNPPYSVGQASGNDNNANLAYPTLDESIRSTYAARSTATNKNSLYDSYIRAIRWASNRVLSQSDGGIVCYVSNGGYIDGNTADGLRLTLTDEFHDIYVYNLRGNQRTAGDLSRKEGGKIFGSGSRNTVAILLLVKRPGQAQQAVMHYKDIGDYLSRDEKLAIVDDSSVSSIDWEIIEPNEHGDWINQRDPNYESYPPIAEKGQKRTIFDVRSGGVASARDAWVYNSSSAVVDRNVTSMIDFYNSEVNRSSRANVDPGELFQANYDSTKIAWSDTLRKQMLRKNRIAANEAPIVQGMYRPFNKQMLWFQAELNERRYQLPRLFPTAECENYGFVITAPSSHYPTFSALATTHVPDLHLHDTGQFFARYSFVENKVPENSEQGDLFAEGADEISPSYTRVDNITDWALSSYRDAYGPDVTKDDIFFYVYGLLHSPEYRERYAADLKKQLPRIPQVESSEDFRAFVDAGRKLSDLHINYETVDPYPLTETVLPGAPDDDYERFSVKKMKYGGKSGAWDKSVIKYNSFITLEDIPEAAQRYMLGSRSGLDWIIERYQVKTDKASGIVNDPNDWSREHEQPRYIIDLLKRITTVSLETMKIVDGLPGLRLR